MQFLGSYLLFSCFLDKRIGNLVWFWLVQVRFKGINYMSLTLLIPPSVPGCV